MSELDTKIDEVAKAIDEIGLEVYTEGMTLAKMMRLGAEHTEQAIGSYGNGVRACGLTAAHVGVEAIKRAKEMQDG
jgi:hypothetical protein